MQKRTELHAQRHDERDHVHAYLRHGVLAAEDARPEEAGAGDQDPVEGSGGDDPRYAAGWRTKTVPSGLVTSIDCAVHSIGTLGHGRRTSRIVGSECDGGHEGSWTIGGG